MKIKIALFICILVFMMGHYIFAASPASYESKYVGHEDTRFKMQYLSLDPSKSNPEDLNAM